MNDSKPSKSPLNKTAPAEKSQKTYITDLHIRSFAKCHIGKLQRYGNTWVDETVNIVIGFADLLPDGYLDMMFVHPEWQGMGASRILSQIEVKAQELCLNRIHTEASITARPFFLQRGFSLLQKQTVEKRGEKLDNFLMEKFITNQNPTSG